MHCTVSVEQRPPSSWLMMTSRVCLTTSLPCPGWPSVCWGWWCTVTTACWMWMVLLQLQQTPSQQVSYESRNPHFSLLAADKNPATEKFCVLIDVVTHFDLIQLWLSCLFTMHCSVSSKWVCGGKSRCLSTLSSNELLTWGCGQGVSLHERYREGQWIRPITAMCGWVTGR